MQSLGKEGRCPTGDWRSCGLPKAVQSQNSAAESRLAGIPLVFGPLTHQNVSPITIMSHCVQEGVVHQEAVPFSPALGLTTNNQLTTRRDLQACEERMGMESTIPACVQGACPLNGPHWPDSMVFSKMVRVHSPHSIV